MTNHVTGRNVRAVLEQADVDPRVKLAIAELFEKYRTLEKSQIEMASLVQMVIAQAEAFNMIAEGMKSKIDGYERNLRQLQDEDEIH